MKTGVRLGKMTTQWLSSTAAGFVGIALGVSHPDREGVHDPRGMQKGRERV